MESVMWLSGEASESIGVRNPSFTELSFIYSISFFSCSNQTFGDTITTNTILLLQLLLVLLQKDINILLYFYYLYFYYLGHYRHNFHSYFYLPL